MIEPWMQTKSGQEFTFLNPKPEQIVIEDIAWALSRKARFNGHTVTKRIYSVAHHSCLAYDYMSDLTDDPNTLLWALLHDATEAYLPDVHTQLKDYLPGFRELENKVEAVIAERYGLAEKSDLIKKIDLQLLATEKRDLMEQEPKPWEPLQGVKPFACKISPWDPLTSYHEFLYRFGEAARMDNVA